MASHHTKVKGDLGLGMAISDLMFHGTGVFIPPLEHQPYAVRKDSALSRVKVKYRKLDSQGAITVRLRNTYSDSRGYHERLVDRTQFDCCAVYCPDNRKLYYVRNVEIPSSNTECCALRVLPPKNNQKKKVMTASDFEDAVRIFTS